MWKVMEATNPGRWWVVQKGCEKRGSLQSLRGSSCQGLVSGSRGALALMTPARPARL